MLRVLLASFALSITLQYLPSGVAADPLFLPKTDYETPPYARSVAIRDINGDGKLDLVASHGTGDSLTVYLGLGDGTFVRGTSSWVPVNPLGFILGRFDSDPWYDLALDCPGCGYVAIGRGDSLGTFSNFSFETIPTTGFVEGRVAAGLLNADSNLDLVAVSGFSNPGFVHVLLGNGDGTFQTYASYLTGVGPQDVALADFNGDGAIDIVVASDWCCPDEPAISLLPGFGDGTFGPRVDLPPAPSGTAPILIALGDINGDTQPDIVTACAGSRIHVLTNAGGSFTAQPALTTDFGMESVALADLDLDGELDVAVATAGGFTDSVQVYLGVGNGTFASPTRHDVAESPFGIAAGDLNGDGHADLVTAGGDPVPFLPPPGNLSVLLNCVPCGTTRISVALLDSRAEFDRVLLRWNVPDARDVCSVQRRTAGSDWAEMGLAAFENPGVVAYEDRSVNLGERYAYRLLVQSASDRGYSGEVWVLVPAGQGAPQALRLDPSYPNPFQTQTTLNFGIPAGAMVKLGIYSVTGRRVATVIDRSLPAGWRSATWDGRDTSGRPVGSGTYFARLESAGIVEIRKIVVAR